MRLAVEIALARAAGRLSRLARAGGGTTVPGKLLWKVDPGAVDRLAARLPLGSALISATNGKTTTAAMAAEILRGRVLMRARGDHDASDAGADVLEWQLAHTEPLSSEERLRSARVDTSNPGEWQETVESLARRFRVNTP